LSQDPYAKTAKKYDRLIEPMNTGLRRIGLKFAPGKPGMKVLDIGCGTGTHLALYQEQGCEVHGIEQSPAMMAEAERKLSGKAVLVSEDATRMSYADKTFDLAILSLVLHETSPEVRSRLLAEAARVIGPEGGILIIDYHPKRQRSWNGLWKKVLILFVERMAGKEHYQNYRHFIAHNGIAALAEKQGLAICESKIVAGGNVGVYLARRN
jgi:ubiquinone/menaquinone biosynthesis C-methylase UbiE